MRARPCRGEAACGASGFLLLLVQAGGRVEIAPLVLVFGLVPAPTFLLWTAFVTALLSVVRQRTTMLAVGLAPFALLPVLIGGLLAVQIRLGFQGEAVAEQAAEYRRQNVATWSGVTPPAIRRIDLDLDLEPAEQRMRVAGTYTVVNPTGEPMRWLPFTVGPAFEDVAPGRWTARRPHLSIAPACTS